MSGAGPVATSRTSHDLVWHETKFRMTPAGLRASRDVRCVARSSRMIADIAAREYETALAAHAHGDLLDIGCGAAPLYSVYRDHTTSATWVDWRRAANGPPLDLEHDLGKPLPFADASFDTILATDVIEHLHDPELFFGEAARVLRPGGSLILGAPFLYWIHEAPHDYHRYTKFRLAQLCAHHALTVVTLKPYGGAFEVLLDITGKIAAPNAVAAVVHAALARLALGSPLRRIFAMRHTENFPLGYTLVARK